VRKGHRAARNPKSRLRQVAVVLTGLLLSFAVLAGLARAGGRYFYCEEMRLTQWDPCSAASHKDKGDVSEGKVCPLRVDCCELWTLPSMPAGTMAEDRGVPAPALVAIIPPSQLLFEHSASDLRRLAGASGRWRIPPRPPGELRAQLMVFLT